MDNGIVDEEHRSLIEMANGIFAIEHPELCREEMTELVKGLYRYMESHFEHEEDLMEQAGVRSRETHAKLHKALIAEMNRELKSNTDLREYAVVLRKIVGEWFIHHVVKVDKEIAEHLMATAE